MTEETYKGILRAKIPWYPAIDFNKCVSCGKCVEYCKLGVYCSKDTDGKNRPEVVNQNNCVVLCKGCQDICPSGAITHPSRKETVNLIRKLRKVQEMKA